MFGTSLPDGIHNDAIEGKTKFEDIIETIFRLVMARGETHK